MKNLDQLKSLNIKKVDLVTTLYKVILERNPDPEGLIHHINSLNNTNDIESFTNILRVFLHSNEFRNIQSLKNNPDFIYKSISSKKKINNKPINHIISLGDHCFTSFLLKNAGLKKYSLPFDWIFSSPEVVKHCIEDDFFHFLNKSYYVSTYNITNEPSSNHLFYEQNYDIKNMFNHVDVTVNDNYEYTIRTVERFQKLLKSDETKLFILIGNFKSNIKESFHSLCNIISSKTNNAALLAIQLQDPTLESGCTELTKVINIGNHNLYNYRSSSYEDGLLFKDRSDELQILRLILTYELDLKDKI